MAERYHTVPPIILPKPCQTIHYSLFTIHSAKLSVPKGELPAPLRGGVRGGVILPLR